MCKDLARSSGMTVAAGTSGFRPPEQERHGVVDKRVEHPWAMSALMEWLADGARMPPAFTRASRPRESGEPAEAARGRRDLAREHRGSTRGPARSGTGLPRTGSRPASPAAPPSPVAGVLPAVALLIIGLLVGLGFGKPVWDDPPVAASDGASLAIDGPETLAEGESATYSARRDGRGRLMGLDTAGRPARRRRAHRLPDTDQPGEGGRRAARTRRGRHRARVSS